MTNEEIIEGNKLIAEFMGIKLIKGINTYTGKEYYYFNNANMQDFEELPDYNTDWNVLMAVVQKIEHLPMVSDITINSVGTFIYCSEIPKHFFPIETTKIESIWDAVVEFIKWYNKNKHLCI